MLNEETHDYMTSDSDAAARHRRGRPSPRRSSTAALIVGLLARATREAWLLTAAVVAAASIAFLARRRWGHWSLGL